MGFKKEAILYFETNADDTVHNRVAVLQINFILTRNRNDQLVR